MSEPNAVAETVEEVVAGVWRWHVWDDRIDFESDAHAVSDEGGTVLIDPLPLQENALKKLEPIIAICLTAACHQRSAWAVPEDVRCAGLRARGLPGDGRGVRR